MAYSASSRESSPRSSTDYGFEMINQTGGSMYDDGWSVMSASQNQAEYFFIGGTDSPRNSSDGSDNEGLGSKKPKDAVHADLSASVTSDVDVAISMILRDSDRQVVQQHVQSFRSEAEAKASKLSLLEEELAARAEEASQLKAELTQQRQENSELVEVAKQQHQASERAAELQDEVAERKKLVARSKEVSQLRRELVKYQEEAKTALAEVAKVSKVADQLRTEVAKHKEEAEVAMKRAEEETARAAEAESIMMAMNIEAESLSSELARADADKKFSAGSASDHMWTWDALQGVWMSEPGKEIHWIDAASHGVWSKEGQWAKIVEYADGFALLPNSEPTCRGELLQSRRGSVLLWPGKGSWIKQSESSVLEAWERGSHQLRCPANHILRWARTSPANSCKPFSPTSKSKRWDIANHMLSACSACNFPVGATEAGMWQCRSCRYNVCGSCAITSAPLGPEVCHVSPCEVQSCQSFTCNACNAVCGPGKSVIGHCVKGEDRYLCLSCLSLFLTQN